MTVHSDVVTFRFRQADSAETAESAWLITGAVDITEVIRWVDENSDGRRFELVAEMDEQPEESFARPRTSGLVRLLASNPNVVEPIEIGLFVSG